ncbi:MAG: glycosyltransferase family 2 protein [Bacillota bacterium]|nr:glycosyltransferase family 2 protein [Bacillota bacterium]
MFSIIIPTFNQLMFTRLCLEFLKTFTTEPYEIIIVDNGSSDGTVNFLQNTDKKIRFISLKSNLGYAAACNKGIDAAKGDYFVLLNNDVLVTPQWLSNIKKALDSRSDAGMVLPVTNLTYGPQIIQVSYPNLKAMVSFSRGYNVSNPARWREASRLPDYCLVIRREVVERIGLLDEQFSPGYFEDDDYSYRARQAGFTLIFTEDTFVHHFSGVTTGKVDSNKTMGDINRGRFKAKWGFDPIKHFQLPLRIVNPLPSGLILNWENHLFLLDGSMLRFVPSSTWASQGSRYLEKIPFVTDNIRKLYPVGPPLPAGFFPGGTLLTSQGNEVFVADKNQRRRVSCPEMKHRLLSQRTPLFLELGQLNNLPEGPPLEISPQNGFPNGFVFTNGKRFFISSDNMLRQINPETALKYSYSLDNPIPLEQKILNISAQGPPVYPFPGTHLDNKRLLSLVSTAQENNRQMLRNETNNPSYLNVRQILKKSNFSAEEIFQ